MPEVEPKEFHRIVAEKQRGSRIDQYLIISGIGVSRNLTQKFIEQGKVLVNGQPVKSSYRIKAGDEIMVKFEMTLAPQIKPADMPLDIIHEDDDLIVVNKNKGIIVHPSRGNFEKTIVNALLHHCGILPTLGDKIRPGVLHRLDKDTTGLIIFAKTDNALRILSRAIEKRQIKKKYHLICWNYPGMAKGSIEAPIGRSGLDRTKMVVSALSDKMSVTEYEVLERFGAATYVRAYLITGRTHQLRVHFKHVGCPVVGDKDYGGRSPGAIRRNKDLGVFKDALKIIDRQALHAAELEFVHPTTGKKVEFSAPLPEDFEKLLAYLRKNGVD